MKIVNRDKNSHIDIAEVNEFAQKDPAGLVRQCEQDYKDQLEELCDVVLGEQNRCRVLLLSGPSSSGKTTTAHKLGSRLALRGIAAPVVSLDDFFLGSDQYPVLPNGKKDMESVYSLDVPFLNYCLCKLLDTGHAAFPIFDFEKSARSEEVNDICLGSRDILIVEGLHALNPVLVEKLDASDIFTAYVSTRTKYVDGGREVLTPKDTRLIRRMVRDHNFRGYSPLSTLLAWETVLEGEEKYIYPFRDRVDFKIDSSHDYEACVYHSYVVPLLDSLRKEPAFSQKAKRIFEILDAFYDVDTALIPGDSMLREFIG